MAALGSGREGQAPLAYRTVLCRYFQSGYCPAGDSCTFIHSSEDGHTPPTQQCKSFLMGACKNGINCPFAHSNPQAATGQQQQQQQVAYTRRPASASGANNEYKMDLCPHRATGACGGPPYCAWAHSVDELVPGKFSLEEIEALRRMQRNGGAAPTAAAAHHSAPPVSAVQSPQHRQQQQQPQQPAYGLVNPYGDLDGYGGPQQAPYAIAAAPAAYGYPAAAAPEPAAGPEAALYHHSRYLAAAPAAAAHYSAYAAPSPYAAATAAQAGPYAAAAAAAYSSPLAHPKAKTKMCSFWPDRCRKGDQCPYIHGNDDPLHVGGPAARLQAAAMASMAAAHSQAAAAYYPPVPLGSKRPRPPPSVIGTKFCKFFLVGACTRGSECTFSHDQRVREREEQQRKLQEQQQLGEQQQAAEQSEGQQQLQIHQGNDQQQPPLEDPPAKRSRTVDTGLHAPPSEAQQKEVAQQQQQQQQQAVDAAQQERAPVTQEQLAEAAHEKQAEEAYEEQQQQGALAADTEGRKAAETQQVQQQKPACEQPKESEATETSIWQEEVQQPEPATEEQLLLQGSEAVTGESS